MRFLLDHDVPYELSYLLRELGHEVLLLRQVLPTEASDEKVFNFARDNGCILITCNRDDFLELASRQPHEPSNSVSGPGQHNRMRSTATTGMIRVPETWNRWGFLARCPSLRRKARF